MLHEGHKTEGYKIYGPRGSHLVIWTDALGRLSWVRVVEVPREVLGSGVSTAVISCILIVVSVICLFCHPWYTPVLGFSFGYDRKLHTVRNTILLVKRRQQSEIGVFWRHCLLLWLRASKIIGRVPVQVHQIETLGDIVCFWTLVVVYFCWKERQGKLEWEGKLERQGKLECVIHL